MTPFSIAVIGITTAMCLIAWYLDTHREDE